MQRLTFIFLFCASAHGCGALSGVDDFQSAAQKPSARSASLGCVTHSDCAGKRVGEYPTTFCSSATHECVALESAECTHVAGPADNDRAVLIGSLFATTGPQSLSNIARQQSAVLAVDEINAIGGLPAATTGDKLHPLVLVACDTSVEPVRAAEYLVKQLRVPAIVGPNSSQNTLDLTQEVSIPGGTVTISPTAVAASIADLRDNDLAWQMVPNDAQRGPLLVHQINETERALRVERGQALKLSVIVRDDALGDGTRASLSDLTWNGQSLANAVNQDGDANIETYVGDGSAQDRLVGKQLDYAPDVIVLVGAGEAISGIMAPLERAWERGAKPEYLLIDSAKVPELLALVEERPDLARRLRGTGVTPSPESAPANQAFLLSYKGRYPDTDQATISGVGPSYDATYAIAYALSPVQGASSGRDVARGLRRLGSGDPIQTGASELLAGFRRLAQGEPITAIGTYSRLAWDDRGAIAAGTLEIWCVDVVNGKARFASSGLTADIPSNELHGVNERCAVPGSSQTSKALQPSAAASTPAMPTPNMPQAGGAAHNTGARPDAGVEHAPDAGGVSSSPSSSTNSAIQVAQPVPCGPLDCRRSGGELCCIRALRPIAFAQDFSCQTDAQSCEAVLRCTSDRQCDHGAICCLTEQRESYCSATSRCKTGDFHLACNGSSDCSAGQRCCSPGNDPVALTATSCASSCEELGAGSLQVCDRQSQCDTSNGCQRKPFLPSVGLCVD